jgi:hypothetical protein
MKGGRRGSGYSRELMRLRGPSTQAIRTGAFRPSSWVMASGVRRTATSPRLTITA